jgi:hypothetical protein
MLSRKSRDPLHQIRGNDLEKSRGLYLDPTFRDLKTYNIRDIFHYMLYLEIETLLWLIA